MKILLMCFLIPATVRATPEVDAAKRSVEALIRPLMAGASKKRPSGTEKFRVDTCEKHKINWMNVLLRREEAQLSFSFKPGCDIEGKIEPRFLEEFPANLNLRNLRDYNRIETTNKVTANLEAKPVLVLEMRAGHLKGSASSVKFEADYRVRFDPAGGSVNSENLGGELRVSEVNGKKVQIKEKIMVR